MIKVAFFHGLESPHRSEKNEILEQTFGEVYAPAMDYHNPEMYNEVLNYLKENPVDLLIGSSMGGYFAHNLSSILNVPTLLFNPALHSRSFEPENVTAGERRPSQLFILGKKDTVVRADRTLNLISNPDFNFPIGIAMENEMEHRVPVDIFTKWINEYTY
jgi:hypothetical protein